MMYVNTQNTIYTEIENFSITKPKDEHFYSVYLLGGLRNAQQIQDFAEHIYHALILKVVPKWLNFIADKHSEFSKFIIETKDAQDKIVDRTDVECDYHFTINNLKKGFGQILRDNESVLHKQAVKSLWIVKFGAFNHFYVHNLEAFKTQAALNGFDSLVEAIDAKLKSAVCNTLHHQIDTVLLDISHHLNRLDDSLYPNESGFSKDTISNTWFSVCQQVHRLMQITEDAIAHQPLFNNKQNTFGKGTSLLTNLFWDSKC